MRREKPYVTSTREATNYRKENRISALWNALVLLCNICNSCTGSTYLPIGIAREDLWAKSNLPVGMLGCFGIMIVMGTVFNEIGEKTPIIRSYLGGGAIVTIFASSAMVYFNLLPTSIATYTINESTGAASFSGTIYNFFAGTGGFLDWYIAALITGSILGMNRKLLVKASARYFPAILGGVIVALGLCALTGWIMGYGGIKAMLLVSLPIVGGGMGAGAVPLSKIFEASTNMTAGQALGHDTCRRNRKRTFNCCIRYASKVFKKDTLNGNGQLLVGKR